MPKAKRRVRLVSGVDEIKFKGGVPHILMEVDGKLAQYAFTINSLVRLHALSLKVIDKALTNQHADVVPLKQGEKA